MAIPRNPSSSGTRLDDGDTTTGRWDEPLRESVAERETIATLGKYHYLLLLV